MALDDGADSTNHASASIAPKQRRHRWGAATALYPGSHGLTVSLNLSAMAGTCNLHLSAQIEPFWP